MYHKVWLGVGSLSLLARYGDQNRCRKYFHLSDNLKCQVWTDGCCKRKHLMEGYDPVTPEQLCCEGVACDGTSLLQFWLPSKNGICGRNCLPKKLKTKQAQKMIHSFTHIKEWRRRGWSRDGRTEREEDRKGKGEKETLWMLNSRKTHSCKCHNRFYEVLLLFRMFTIVFVHCKSGFTVIWWQWVPALSFLMAESIQGRWVSSVWQPSNFKIPKNWAITKLLRLLECKVRHCMKTV